MKHQEVKQFAQELNILAAHLQKNNCKNYTLNYAIISRNIPAFTKAAEDIDKIVNPELIELEKSAMSLLEAENKKIEEANKTAEKKLPLLKFEDGIKLLSKEEQAKHAELMIAYNAMLQEENDIKIYKVKAEKLEDVPIEIGYMSILEKMIE